MEFEYLQVQSQHKKVINMLFQKDFTMYFYDHVPSARQTNSLHSKDPGSYVLTREISE